MIWLVVTVVVLLVAVFWSNVVFQRKESGVDLPLPERKAKLTLEWWVWSAWHPLSWPSGGAHWSLWNDGGKQFELADIHYSNDYDGPQSTRKVLAAGTSYLTLMQDAECMCLNEPSPEARLAEFQAAFDRTVSEIRSEQAKGMSVIVERGNLKKYREQMEEIEGFIRKFELLEAEERSAAAATTELPSPFGDNHT